MPSAPRLTCFLVKIASRCNLACDYCYMYRHADQSWRSRPWVMSEKHRQQLAARIAEYVQGEKLKDGNSYPQRYLFDIGRSRASAARQK